MVGVNLPVVVSSMVRLRVAVRSPVMTTVTVVGAVTGTVKLRVRVDPTGMVSGWGTPPSKATWTVATIWPVSARLRATPTGPGPPATGAARVAVTRAVATGTYSSVVNPPAWPERVVPAVAVKVACTVAPVPADRATLWETSVVAPAETVRGTVWEVAPTLSTVAVTVTVWPAV